MTKKADYINTHPAEYELGRRSRLSGIAKDDAPYGDAEGNAGDALKAWQAGYDAAEDEAARNETSAPDDAPKAEDQLKTATKK